MALQFHNVVYEVPPSKRGGEPTRILHGVSGSLSAGESLAILGPSGSGKTTLLNLLADRSMYGLRGGCILFNGTERTSRTKREIGYVMQDDLFFSELTVRETLQFTADIRIPKTVSAEEKSKRIDEIITSLRLNQCENTHIGDQIFFKGISGGERKRLNIANELIHDPSILLGDECTSGLDSSSALTVIQLVRQLTNQGKTIICTIHQPSSQMFNLFDKVMLLSSGRVAYFGRPDAVQKYFTSIGYPLPSTMYNPADYMLELVIDDLPSLSCIPGEKQDLSPQQQAKRIILAAWAERGPEPFLGTEQTDASIMVSEEFIQPMTTNELKKGPVRAIKKRYWAVTRNRGQDPLPTKYPVNFAGQVRALMRRSMLQKRGNVFEKVKIMEVALVTIVSLGFWFRMRKDEDTINDRVGALFFALVYWAFYGVFEAVFTFPYERAVLNKDRASGAYRLSAYYIAKTTVDLPVDLFYPLLFTLIWYWSVGLNPSLVSFLLHTLTVTLTVSVSFSVGIVLSAIFVNAKEAQVIGTTVILASMLFGGYYIPMSNLPKFLRYLTHISYIKFGYEAFVRIEVRGQSFPCVSEGKPHSIYSDNGSICPVDEQSLLRAAQVDPSISISGNLAILVLWILGLRVIGYLALKYLNRRHKPGRRDSKEKRNVSAVSEQPRDNMRVEIENV